MSKMHGISEQSKKVLPVLSSDSINELEVPGQNSQDLRGVGRASDAFRHFFDDFSSSDGKKLHAKTELSDEEIKEINKLYILGRIYHIKVMDEFLEGFMRLRVSKNRKGIGEFLQALVSAAQLDLAETKVANAQDGLVKQRGGFHLFRQP
jgi:hypothetical protein